jgi:WD40 repeat protein
MSDPKPQTNLYTIGGAVQADGGLYLPRVADDELLELCRTGNFSYVLTPRQMGKTSLMVRTAERLGEEGIQSVIIDLTAFGVQVTVEAWYLGLLAAIEEKLMFQTNVIEWWQARQEHGLTQRLVEFFKDVLLKEVKGRVVIFVDEIDTTLNLPFTDDFYAAIRYFYNARAHTPELKRLSFVLIGVATPGDLIRDPQRTPFNIGHRVDLTDFTMDEALPLAEGLGLPADEARSVLGWVMEWTNGHPYLTQRLCRAVAEAKREHWTQGDVDALVGSIFLGEMSEKDNNLQFVRDMLTKRAPDKSEVLTTYREVRRARRPVADEEQSIVKSHLKLSGIVYRKQGSLRVRNAIYSEVFDDHWVSQHLPINWAKRLQRAAIALVVLILLALIPLSVYAINRAWEAERKKAEAERNKEEADKQRQLAEAQRMIAEQERARAIEAKQQAEDAAEKEALAKAEAVKQRQFAEEQRARAEEEASRANKQTEIAKAREVEAAHLRQLALGGQLGAIAEVTRTQQPILLERSAIIARESILQSPDSPPVAGYQALYNALSLLPRPFAGFSTEFSATRTSFTPNREFLIVLSEDGLASRSNARETVYVLDPKNDYKEIPKLTRQFLKQNSYLSPDLTYLATVNKRAVTVVELTSGKEKPLTLKGEVRDFMLTDRGRYAAYVDEDDRTVHLLDVQANREVDSWQEAEGQTRVLTLSPTGKYLLTLTTVFSPDDKYMLEMITNEDLLVKRTSDFETVTATVKKAKLLLDFHPDSQFLAVVTENDVENDILQLVELESGRALATISQRDKIRQLRFSPDGKYLAALGTRMASVMKTTDAYEEVSRIIVSGLRDIDFGPNDKLVTVSDSKAVQIWETKSDEDFIYKTLEENIVESLLTPNGKYMAEVRSDDKKTVQIKIWDTAETRSGPVGIMNFEEDPKDIALSLDGKYVAATFDDVIRVWEVTRGRLLREIKAEGEVTTVAVGAGGKYVAAIIRGNPMNRAQVWEVATGNKYVSVEEEGLDFTPIFSPDAEYLAAGANNVRVIRLADRKTLATFNIEGRLGVQAMMFSSHGKYLAASSVEVKVWARDTGQVLTLLSAEGENFTENIVFSGNERYLAAAVEDDVAEVWDVEAALRDRTTPKDKTKKSIATIKPEVSVYSMALTSDGKYLAMIDRGDYARIWNLSSSREVARIPYSAMNSDDRIAFTGNNDTYLVMARDSGAAQIRLWKPDDLVRASCSRLILRTSDVPWEEYLDKQLLKNLKLLGDCPQGK